MEPEFTLEQFRKDKSEYEWQALQLQSSRNLFVPANDVPVESNHHSDTSDSSSSSSSSSESSSSQSATVRPTKSRREAPIFDEAEVGLYRSTWHVVLHHHPKGSSPVPPDIILTACGRKFQAVHFQRRDFLELQHHQALCTHPSCRKGWSAIGA